MKRIILSTTLALAFLVGMTAGTTVFAADSPDPLGVRDTLYTEISSLGKYSWRVEVGVTNDAELFALSVPLKFTAGLTRLYIDSTIFTGGRVDHFKIKKARVDTAIQCLTVGLIADLTPQATPLREGRGGIASVFVHADPKGDIPSLKVDTTTTTPSNNAMFVNTDASTNTQVRIYPAYVSRSAGASTKAAEEPKGKK